MFLCEQPLLGGSEFHGDSFITECHPSQSGRERQPSNQSRTNRRCQTRRAPLSLGLSRCAYRPRDNAGLDKSLPGASFGRFGRAASAAGLRRGHYWQIDRVALLLQSGHGPLIQHHPVVVGRRAEGLPVKPTLTLANNPAPISGHTQPFTIPNPPTTTTVSLVMTNRGLQRTLASVRIAVAGDPGLVTVSPSRQVTADDIAEFNEEWMQPWAIEAALGTATSRLFDEKLVRHHGSRRADGGHGPHVRGDP